MTRLTQTVKKGGCAAKVEATELRKILSQVRFPARPPELLLDGHLFDDAAIFQVNEQLALVQTLDFFTPIVDTPHLFGQIAACNALSDVYAMGGTPRTAMGILAFPLSEMDDATITEVMQGACDMLSQAKTPLVGGHSIDDETLKFGLAVTGYVNPKKVWSNQAARPGHKLILTKPLGTGTLTAALKRNLLIESDLSEVWSSMTRLNNVLDYLSEDLANSIHAATDITGFGLSGHSLQMARASQCGFRINMRALPTFSLAPQFIKQEILTKAHRTNHAYTAADSNTANLTNDQRHLINDPQTSGGLLLAVDGAHAQKIVEVLTPYFPGANIIGEVAAGAPYLEFCEI